MNSTGGNENDAPRESSNSMPPSRHDGIEEQETDVSLQQENQRLRSELDELKSELSRLQQEQQQKSESASPSSSLREVAQRARHYRRSWDWLNGFQRPTRDEEAQLEDEEKRGIVDDQSVDDDGDQELMEVSSPDPPSPMGLHHRRGPTPGTLPKFHLLTDSTTPPESPQQSLSFKSKNSDPEIAFSTSDDLSPAQLLHRDDDDNLSGTSVVLGANDGTFKSVLKDRASWLVGLLVLQSCSSFIIKNNEGMLSHHLVIVRFLTMLVGAGGNAGNQASVRVIRGLAIGTVNNETARSYLEEEMKMGLCLSAILGVAGCIRAAVFLTPVAETLAITSSLVMIVAISICLGALLPLGMKYVSIDPAHSSTTIQVLMDILGVTITVYVSAAILDGPFGVLLGADPHI